MAHPVSHLAHPRIYYLISFVPIPQCRFLSQIVKASSFACDPCACTHIGGLKLPRSVLSDCTLKISRLVLSFVALVQGWYDCENTYTHLLSIGQNNADIICVLGPWSLTLRNETLYIPLSFSNISLSNSDGKANYRVSTHHH